MKKYIVEPKIRIHIVEAINILMNSEIKKPIHIALRYKTTQVSYTFRNKRALRTLFKMLSIDDACIMNLAGIHVSKDRISADFLPKAQIVYNNTTENYFAEKLSGKSHDKKRNK